jgi:iron(III) transport system permease protein
LVINKIISLNFRKFFTWPRTIVLGLPVFLIIYQGLNHHTNQNDIIYLLKILPELIKNTGLLLICVVIFSSFWGLFFSITLSLTNLPGRYILKKLLFLPLALPLYVSSFIFIGATDYGSGLNIFCREYFNINIDLITRELGSVWIGFIFSLYLSPYLSIAMTKAMDSIGVNQWPVAKTMGLSNFEVVKKILLPGVSPWFFASMMIISMEVLSDFGGVSAFNYDTLSTGIYTAWTGLFNYGLALKISLILIIFSVTLFSFEKKIKGKKSFQVKGRSHMSHPPIHLSKLKSFTLYIPIVFYFILSIIAPASYLISWTFLSDEMSLNKLVPLTLNTIYLGIGLASTCSIGSYIYTYISKDNGDYFKKYIRPFELMGYSLPGPIIAISFISIFTFLNRIFGLSINLSGIFVLTIAIFYRFLFIGERNWSSAFERVNNSAINTAKVLGLGYLSRFKLTYYPVLKVNIVPIFSLLFLEVIKELPITLMLRPFGLNTLSINIYELTSEGEWERAASSALVLLLLGAPIVLITNLRSRK